MYPILEYSGTYLTLEYYAYFHTYTLYIYPVFVLSVYMYILTVSVYTILIHTDSFNTLLIENRTTQTNVCESHETLFSLDSKIVFLRTRHTLLVLHLPVSICSCVCWLGKGPFSPYRHVTTATELAWLGKRLCRRHPLYRKRRFLDPVCVSLSPWNLQWRDFFCLTPIREMHGERLWIHQMPRVYWGLVCY